MCGIAGFTNRTSNYLSERDKYINILKGFVTSLIHRGPDDNGIFLDECCGLAHDRLSIIDISNGAQPMHCHYAKQKYTIVYNGEIYNMPHLRQQLEKEGMEFDTSSDTEVILKGYCKYGTAYFSNLNGIFAIAIFEHMTKRLILCRDRLGVKPLFYTLVGNTLIFASEVKSLFTFPGCTPVVDSDGLCELFALGPAHTPGRCVYKDIKEVLPGHFMIYSDNILEDYVYWRLSGSFHKDSLEDTIEHTRYLVKDAIELQMLSDIPICCFLSGGLDSSIVSSVCASKLKKEGKTLSTYSFDFVNNGTHYIKNDFQPSLDAPFAELMANYIESKHTELFCDNITLADYLYTALDSRDYPCMADVESSLAYFCKRVSANHKVALTGECADEIFGGYPWFYKQELFDLNDFPWSHDMETRSCILNDRYNSLPLYEYSHNAYLTTINETPACDSDSMEECRRRQLSYLNLRYFMATLLERMDRTSMNSGLEARVPFADHRIVEYLYNVPWEMKSCNKVEKGLLREAMKDYLPDSVYNRKKSPYPKTYNPIYETILKERFRTVINNSNSPILEFIDKKKAHALINSKLQYTNPWYGQLMAGPQLIAYYLQINYWLLKYNPVIKK